MAPSLASSTRVTGPSRLRHQDAAPRHGRAARRPDLRRRRDGPDGVEPRRVDCRDRLVRPEHVRQRRLVCLGRGRRARARGHGRPQDVLDGRRAHGVAAGTARRACRPGKRRASHNPDSAPARSTSRRGRPALRSSRACGSRSSCRSQRSSPRSSSTRPEAGSGAAEDVAEGAAGAPAAGGAGAPPADAAAAGGSLPACIQSGVSTNGSSWKPLPRAQGTPGATTIAFAPIEAKFIRITQTATAEDGAVWSMQRLRLYRPGTGGGSR